MPQLIPFEKRALGRETIETVDARDLHRFLEVKQRFNDWIVKRIQQYGFAQDVDFTCYCLSSSENPNPPIEYFLTIDMAKQVSMVERNAKGREAREYFIACEKALQNHSPIPKVKDQAIQMIIDLAVQLDEARTIAQEAREIAHTAELVAAHADNKAMLALHAQQWVPIRQYVYTYGLGHQMPLSRQKAYARYLGEYHSVHGIPMYKAATADVAWPDERTYHVQAIHDTLAPWLQRETGQAVFLVPPVEGV